MNIWNDPTADLDERADALVAAMTLEEKVGQLGSYWPNRLTSAEIAGDVAPMESAMGAGLSRDDSTKHGLGHLTRVFGTEPIAVKEGIQALRALQGEVVDRSRFGIPAIAHEECLTGFTTLGATVYPAPIAWGATFDPELIQEMAHAIGADMKAVGVDQGLSPLLDVVHDYRWGRVEETMGEDPYVVATLGTAYVQGLQRAGVIATLKHFAGYAASKAGRNHAPVSMGRREFEDQVLPPFEMAVRVGRAGSVMNSYSDIDGLPAGASPELLTGVLRDRWGFEGTVVSDYWSVVFLDLMHHVSEDALGAGILALEAGVDVELPGTAGFADLVVAVTEGRLAEAVVDRAARRVLRQKIEIGMMDPGFEAGALGRDTNLDSPRNRDIARRLAAQSIILLHNTGVLPLTGEKRVALVGPCADEPRSFLGCYSFPNHVLARHGGGAERFGIDVPSLFEALRAELADSTVTHERGVPFVEADRAGLDAAVRAAAGSDVAIVAVGDLAGLFGEGTSGEGCDVVDLHLPGIQEELVESILATGTPTVLVVVSGRPYALGVFADRCAAVVQAFMPGEEGGAALAGVLAGRLNPEGKLPVGIPSHHGGQPGTYLAAPLAWYSEGISSLDPRPLYPFGFGMSYSHYELTDLELSNTQVPVDGHLDASVTVTNTGDRAGAEVVQLYLADRVAQVARPMKQLIGYAKVRLEPAEAKRVTFEVHMDRASFVGRDHDRVVEPGEIRVMVGSSSEDLPLQGVFEITGELRRVPEGRALTTLARIAAVPAGALTSSMP